MCSYLSENAIYKGLDVLVGTPGRIMDHLERGNLDLSKLEYVILDEVDQMLDMGFADSVDTIIKSAYNRGDHISCNLYLLWPERIP